MPWATRKPPFFIPGASSVGRASPCSPAALGDSGRSCAIPQNRYPLSRLSPNISRTISPNRRLAEPGSRAAHGALEHNATKPQPRSVGDEARHTRCFPANRILGRPQGWIADWWTQTEQHSSRGGVPRRSARVFIGLPPLEILGRVGRRIGVSILMMLALRRRTFANACALARSFASSNFVWL